MDAAERGSGHQKKFIGDEEARFTYQQAGTPEKGWLVSKDELKYVVVLELVMTRVAAVVLDDARPEWLSRRSPKQTVCKDRQLGFDGAAASALCADYTPRPSNLTGMTFLQKRMVASSSSASMDVVRAQYSQNVNRGGVVSAYVNLARDRTGEDIAARQKS